MKNALIFFICTVVFLASCVKEEPTGVSKNFTVTVQNTFETKNYFVNGTTGVILPGESESFSFNAGIGHYLQFATMFVQSNDLFYAPDDEGIALYSFLNPLTGDITGMLQLWDAGTEVNEEPGVGPNQPPRQAGANTGMDENATVESIQNVNDGFSYPDLSDVVRVMLSHDGGTLFTVTIENISDGSALPTPLAPGTWVVHKQGDKPIFTEGAPASPGLEALAEDGDISKMDSNLSSKSGFFSPFTPGAYSIGNSNDIFTLGRAADSALESLAEDGVTSGYTNVFNTPVGSTSPGPLLPGASYSFNFSAEEGQNLSFVSMFVQSNDWFVGLDNLPLFIDGKAISGDITNRVLLYDAGTEVDEYPGAGNNQPLRQTAMNTGADENATVAVETNVGAHVPMLSNYIKVSISTN